MSGSCNQGTGRKSKSRGNNLRSLLMCCLDVAWVKSIAHVCVSRTLSPRPDSHSIRSHAREVETLTLSERHFRLSTCIDSTLILQVKKPYSSLLYLLTIFINVYQYHTMCSKQGKPSVPVHLTLMPSSSVGRNSDRFLGLPVPLLVLPEHSTTAWHKRQPKKLPPKNCFEIQCLKARVSASDG